MRSTLEQLLQRLRDIDAFVSSIRMAERGEFEDAVAWQRAIRLRKRFDHAAFIISLYATMERYVEELVWAYARYQARRAEYANLPQKLREKNVRRSGELLSKHRRLGEGRWKGLGAPDVVANLHGCLAGVSPYQLTKEVVVFHDDQNLRASVVQDLFATVGVEDVHNRARFVDALEAWYQTDQKLVTLSGGVPDGVIAARLDALVQSRNQVAHAGADSGEVDAVDEMDRRVRFVEAYCRSLFVVAVEGSLTGVESLELANVHRIQRKGPGVVVATMPNRRLTVGQPIYGVRDARVDRVGVIEEIQCDGRPVESVEPLSGIKEVGLKVSFPVARETRLFVPVNPDHAVW